MKTIIPIIDVFKSFNALLVSVHRVLSKKTLTWWYCVEKRSKLSVSFQKLVFVCFTSELSAGKTANVILDWSGNTTWQLKLIWMYNMCLGSANVQRKTSTMVSTDYIFQREFAAAKENCDKEWITIHWFGFKLIRWCWLKHASFFQVKGASEQV